jgi:hypothetical protein
MEVNQVDLTAEVEQALAADNSNGRVTVMHQDPRMQARLDAVRTGMAETQALYAERDHYRREAAELRIQVQELGIAVDQAREAEKLHVAAVMRDLATEGRKSEVAQELLRGENARLGQVISDAMLREQQLRQRIAELEGFCKMIRAGIDKVVP